VNADQNGRFLLNGIAPGRYHAFAAQSFDDDAGIFWDSGFRRRLENFEQSLVVEEKAALRVSLTLIPESTFQSAQTGK
jgi:hypothetical protein